MIKIILVEDNPAYAGDVAEFLGEIGYRVEVAASAGELRAALGREPAEVVILDLGLPDEDGFRLIPQLRKLHPHLGLIVLTARVTTDNRIQGLRLGADDYLTKPIKFPKLSARIEALCRRLHPRIHHAPPLWVLNMTARQVGLHGQGVAALTDKEFNFLHLLAQNRQPVPRKALLIAMGERDEIEAAGKMDMLVYRLRKKIKTALGQELPLRSEYGGGYSLSAPFHIDWT